MIETIALGASAWIGYTLKPWWWLVPAAVVAGLVHGYRTYLRDLPMSGGSPRFSAALTFRNSMFASVIMTGIWYGLGHLARILVNLLG